MQANDPSKNTRHGIEFLIGGVAATGATVFTNPIDVIKTRLQLQGELEARGSYNKVYKNTFHAAYVIVKHEGILTLQAGFTSALAFQFVMNGLRLGIYNTCKNYDLISNERGNTAILKTIMVSGLAGCFSAVIASPLYLVKTQIQSQSSSMITAVGHQHRHKNTWSALKSLWMDGGIAGLYRDCHANIPRLFMGSAAQLTTFSTASDYLEQFEVFKHRPIFTTFVSSFLGGSCVALVMQPFDVLTTRIFNQRTTTGRKGMLYNGLIDGLTKIIKTEGTLGLYKGVFPAWIRIAPHTVLCLVFYEKLAQIL